METLINDFNEFLKNIHILEPDQRIVEKISMLDNRILSFNPRCITNQFLGDIENLLIKCLFINDGAISFQCSLYISDFLIEKIYFGERKTKIWSIITAMIESPKPSIIFAVGNIIKRNGKYTKSLIPGILKCVTSTGLFPDYDYFPQIYCILWCFKVSFNDSKEYNSYCFKMIKKQIFKWNESTKLYSIKLLKIMLHSDIGIKDILSLIHQLLEENQSNSIIDESIKLICKCAILQIKKINDDSYELSETFQTIQLFPKYVKKIILIFIQLLDKNEIHKIKKDLFDFILKNSYKSFKHLINVLEPDDILEFYSQFSSNLALTLENFDIVTTLSYNYSCFCENASLAIQMTSYGNIEFIQKGAIFFYNVISKDTELSFLFLKTSTTFLSNPQLNSYTIKQDLCGMSYVSAAILKVIGDKNIFFKMIKNNIETFFAKSIKCESIFNPLFQPIFILLSSLPNYHYYSEGLNKLILMFTKDANKCFNPEVLDISNSIALFSQTHSYLDSIPSFFEFIASNKNVQTPINLISLLIIYPKIKIKTKINWVQIIKYLISKSKPSSKLLLSLIKFPYLSNFETLKEDTKKDDIQIFSFVDPKSLAYLLTRNFTSFFTSLSEGEALEIVDFLSKSCSKSIMEVILLLDIIPTNSFFKFLSANELLKSLLKSNFKEDLEIQLVAECIGNLAEIDASYILTISESIHTDKKSCFILSSLLADPKLSIDFVFNNMLFLNDLLKNKQILSYALHAMSKLFFFQAEKFNDLTIINIQIHLLLSIFLKHDLEIHVLYNISNCLNQIMKLLKNFEDISLLENNLLIMFKLISSNQYKFSSHFYYNSLYQFYTLFSEKIKNFNLQYPMKKGIYYSNQIYACNALSKIINSISFSYDFDSIIPNVLLILQITKNSNLSDFIYAIANNFIKYKNQNNKIEKWGQFIKTCLSAGIIPQVGESKILARKTVKICMINCIKIFLPLINNNDNDFSMDIMSSLSCCIESRDYQMQNYAYKLISNIIEKVFSKGDKRFSLELFKLQLHSCLNIALNRFSLSNVFFFLMDYLDIITNDCNINQNNIIEKFVNGLLNREFITPEFVKISTKLCIIARKDKKYVKTITPLFPKLKKIFLDLVNDTISLLNDEKSIIKINIFRKDYSNIFKDIIASLIWIKNNLNENDINPTYLIDFLDKEIQNQENWRFEMGFNTFIEVLKYLTISNNELVKSIDLVYSLYKNNAAKFKPLIKEFLINSSSILKENNTESWYQIMNMMNDNNYDPKILCYLIKKSNIKDKSKILTDFTINKYKNGNCSKEYTLLLFKLLFYFNTEHVKIISTLFEFNESFTIDLFQTCLIFVQREEEQELTIYLPKISCIIWKNFEENGFKLLACIISRFPESSSIILNDSKHYKKHLNKIRENKKSIPKYLKIIKIIIERAYQDNINIDNFVSLTIKFCLHLILKNISESITKESGNVISIVSIYSCPLIRLTYKSLDTYLQKQLNDTLLKYIKYENKKTNNKTINKDYHQKWSLSKKEN